MPLRRSAPVALLAAAFAVSACHDGPTAPTTGAIAVAIAGLPATATASIAVVGPGGFSRTVSASDTLRGLQPGLYAFAPQRVHGVLAWYAGTTDTLRATVVAGQVQPVAVTYAIATASLSFVFRNVPPGTSPTALVNGPNGFQARVTAKDTLHELTPGSYNIVADTATYLQNRWAATATPGWFLYLDAKAGVDSLVLQYAPITFTMTVAATAPAGTAGGVATLTGPNGYRTRLAAGSTQVPGLFPGAYTLAGDTLAVGGATWDPQPATQSVNFTGASNAGITWTQRTTTTGGFNLALSGVTLTQVTQNAAGTVPLMAGRSALLRVYVAASQTNTATPAVRVHLYANGALASTLDLTATASSVALSPDVTSLTTTYNTTIPASLVQPGLSIDAQVDPAGQYTETTRTDDVWPASGQQKLDVRVAATPQIRFVPITDNGLTGNVSDANTAQFMTTFTKVWPVNGYVADVRTPYVTSAPAFDSKDTSGAWSRVLSEVEALRVAEGSTRYYYGVLHVTYNSGIAGLGFVGGKSAIGWDYLPTGADVMAHELGHNFGRLHSPCGGPSGVDPSYPYPSGNIGVPGLSASNTLIPATANYDIMSYCHPQWVSDYTYAAVFNALSAAPAVASSAAVVGSTDEDCLLVWGHVLNGTLVLEPSFEVHTRPSLPARSGPYTVHGVDASGTDLFSVSFAGQEIADLPGASTFAFAVPLSAAHRARLAEVRLAGNGRVVRNAAVSAGGDPEIQLTRSASGRAMLRWNAAKYPMVMVRDAQSGAVLSFARGGQVRALAARGDVDLVFSNRVHSTTHRVTPQ